MMTKYIDRDALIEWLKSIPLIDLSDGRGLCRVIMEDDFKKAIKKMPKGIIADVAPVRHGRWECHGDCGVTECSACGWSIEEYVGDYAYCPNCGANMDKGVSE